MPVGSPTLGNPETIADLIARIQQDLRGETREAFGYLSGSLSAGTTPELVALAASVPQISTGALVAIDEELLLVTAVSGTNVTLARGVQNTNITTHAAGSIVEANPRFFPFAIGNAIVEEIRSWPPDLYVTDTVDVAFGAADHVVDFDAPAGFRSVLAGAWFGSGSDHWVTTPTLPVVVPNASTDLYPSGFSVSRSPQHFGYMDSGTLRVVVSKDYTLADISLATELADIGIPASCYDVVVYGCLWRLLAPREVGRLGTTSQPQPRAKGDVPARATLAAAAGYKQLRDERLAEEVMRLRETYRPGGA